MDRQKARALNDPRQHHQPATHPGASDVCPSLITNAIRSGSYTLGRPTPGNETMKWIVRVSLALLSTRYATLVSVGFRPHLEGMELSDDVIDLLDPREMAETEQEMRTKEREPRGMKRM